MVTIAVSGKPGAGSSTVSRLLAKKLGLRYFSPGEKFFKAEGKLNDNKKALETWKSPEGGRKEFHEKIDNYQKELAKKGNIVICGKLSIWILKDLTDLKIWLECSFDERARRVAKRDKISLEKAQKELREREIIEEKEWKRLYGLERNSQREMADLVIDSENLRVDEIIEKIMLKINQNFMIHKNNT